MYRENNKEKMKDYNKNIYEKKKEEYSLKGKEKYICVCGSICRIYEKQRHFRTEKHINFIS